MTSRSQASSANLTQPPRIYIPSLSVLFELRRTTAFGFSKGRRTQTWVCWQQGFLPSTMPQRRRFIFSTPFIVISTFKSVTCLETS